MSEELKPCPICELEPILNDWTYNYKYGIECTNCSISNYGWVTKEECIDHWNNLPRLTEQKKAEIVANMWGEYFCENGSVTPQEPTAKFLHWIEQKAKGER